MRLFDASEESRRSAKERRDREETKKRAAEAEEALRELEEVDEASRKLGAVLADAKAVAPIVYKEHRVRGSKWLIEHSAVGPDYVFQLHPLKAPTAETPDVLTSLIGAMDAIYPRSIQIRYVPPHASYQVKFYTIRVEGLVGKPGWERAVERSLEDLSRLDMWQKRLG